MREPLGKQQTEALAVMRQLLGEEYLSLEVGDYELREDFVEERCQLTAKITERPAKESFRIEGTGVGILDAFFHGLRARYEGEHASLASIKFSSFNVRGLMGEGTGQASDAQAEATVGVTNSSGTEFLFEALSPSVSHSSLEACLAAVEYFINAERAYVRAWRAMQHHKQQGRPEQAARYTNMLAIMVRNTSYSTVIERLREEDE